MIRRPEVEPGATVIEKVTMPEPTGFDAPEKLVAFLDAVRWGATNYHLPECNGDIQQRHLAGQVKISLYTILLSGIEWIAA